MKACILILALLCASVFANWTKIDCGVVEHSVTSIASLGAEVLVGTEGEGAFYSSDSGTTWSKIVTGLPTTLSKSIRTITVGSGVFVVGTAEGIYKLSDDKSSFIVICASFRIDAATYCDSNKVWWFGYYSSGAQPIRFMAYTNSFILTAGTSGKILYSGTSSILYSSMLTVGKKVLVSTMANNLSAETTTVYLPLDTTGTRWRTNITAYGFRNLCNDNGKVYGVSALGLFCTSADTGKTWTTNTSIQNRNGFYHSMVATNGYVFVGTDSGVIYSNNKTTWNSYASKAVTGQSQNYAPLMVYGSSMFLGCASGLYKNTLPSPPTSVEVSQPKSIQIKAYPNPFSSSVTIGSFGNANVSIFNLSGQRVANFRGVSKVNWTPRNEASGLYLVKVEANGHTYNERIRFTK